MNLTLEAIEMAVATLKNKTPSLALVELGILKGTNTVIKIGDRVYYNSDMNGEVSILEIPETDWKAIPPQPTLWLKEGTFNYFFNRVWVKDYPLIRI